MLLLNYPDLGPCQNSAAMLPCSDWWIDNTFVDWLKRLYGCARIHNPGFFSRPSLSAQTMKDSLTSTVAHKRGTQRMETSLNLSFLDIHPKRGLVGLIMARKEFNALKTWFSWILEWFFFHFPTGWGTQTIHQLFKVEMKAPVMKPRWKSPATTRRGASQSEHLSILVQFIPINCSTVAGTWWPAPFWSCWIRTWRSLRPCRDLEKCHQQQKKADRWNGTSTHKRK